MRSIETFGPAGGRLRWEAVVAVACLAPATVLVTAAQAKGPQALKLVVTPKVVSLTRPTQSEFSVEVSGQSHRHAQLAVFLEDEPGGSSCAPNVPEELKRPGVQEENPAQKEPGNVERYPETLGTDFTGSFDWDTNALEFTKEARPGRRLICAYLSPVTLSKAIPPSAAEEKEAEEHETEPAPKELIYKPFVKASAAIDVVEGGAPKGH
ncbi:MAG TPA: hypothetical protein VGC32_10875 [Solirubrobacterales bacterium]